METILNNNELVDVYASCGDGQNNWFFNGDGRLQEYKYALSWPVLDTVVRSLRVIIIQQVYHMHILIAMVNNSSCHKKFRSIYY